ncbi:MAG: head GIN domain-containing protein [Sedimenticolaceae bacterium]
MKYSSVAFALSLAAGAVSAESVITINGKTIRSTQGSIVVQNNTVIVDGRVVSGEVVEGSGNRASEQRDLGDFDELQLHINAEVTVTAGQTPKCEITADDNLLALILTQRSGDTLQISAQESYSTRQAITIAIEVPVLTSAENNGSGTIRIDGVTRDTVALAINGSGDISARGHVMQLQAAINGSGDLRAAGLEAKTAAVSINGSGNAEVHAREALTANINGSGDLSYLGSPASVRTAINGSGSVRKK